MVTMRNMESEKGRKIYLVRANTGVSQASFGPRMDRGGSSYRPPFAHISADTPWVNILSWSVNQMKSEGGIPLTRRERVASLEAVLVKKK